MKRKKDIMITKFEYPKNYNPGNFDLIWFQKKFNRVTKEIEKKKKEGRYSLKFIKDYNLNVNMP
jgi:hypothetical protein